MIAIIDYDAGNIKSVEKALILLGEDVVLTRDRDVLLSASKVILPGVGSFGDSMINIRKYGLETVIHEVIKKGTLFLGICLGMQLLFESSEESPDVPGLSVLKGKIVKIPKNQQLKIPHMGWNSLDFQKKGTLFQTLPSHPYVYFVHSFYLQADDKSIVTATSDYGCTIEAAIEYNNVFACQFHPEKSSCIGLKILQNFISL